MSNQFNPSLRMPNEIIDCLRFLKECMLEQSSPIVAF